MNHLLDDVFEILMGRLAGWGVATPAPSSERAVQQKLFPRIDIQTRRVRNGILMGIGHRRGRSGGEGGTRPTMEADRLLFRCCSSFSSYSSSFNVMWSSYEQPSALFPKLINLFFFLFLCCPFESLFLTEIKPTIPSAMRLIESAVSTVAAAGIPATALVRFRLMI